MPVDTGAINTILQAYLAGRGIREQNLQRQERAVAEQTRQKERGEDIKRSEEHFAAQQKLEQSQFDLQKAIAQLNQNKSVLDLYEQSGGNMLPSGSELQGTMWEDSAGVPQDMPVYRTYSYKGIGGEPQTIQLPNVQYQNELALRQAEQKQQRETEAELKAKEPFAIREFQRQKNYELSKMPVTEEYEGRKMATEHKYKMEEIEAQAKGQREVRESAKKDFTATAKRAALHPEMLDTMTPGDRDLVTEEILKNNYNWLPPVVSQSYNRLNQALDSVSTIEKIPGYTGMTGNLARNLGGQTTALDLEVQGLRNLLTQDKLGLMRGLGHMSDNDVKIIQGALTSLDVKNPNFKQVLARVKKGIQTAISELEKRNAAQPVDLKDIDLSGTGGTDLGADFDKLFPPKKPR